MQIINETKLDFDDVLIRPKRSEAPSRKTVELLRSYKTLKSESVTTSIPIIASNMDTVGCISIARVLSKFKIHTCLHKFYDEETLIKFWNEDESHSYCFYTVGINDKDISKLKHVSQHVNNIWKICIDVANGYSSHFQRKVKEIRQMFPDSIIMAGNVATPEMVQELLISGDADIIKIGIGPGSVCKTRKVTGVGYPQLSAIIECADAAHGLGGLVCSDGGCKEPGDIVKAFGAGADFVMIGGMFAGHDECEGEWEYGYEVVQHSHGAPVVTGAKIKKSIKFYGMSSKEAMDKYSGGMENYKASEGECIQVPYKGPIEGTVQQILGGLRSACAYVGARSLKDLSKCTTFVRKR